MHPQLYLILEGGVVPGARGKKGGRKKKGKKGKIIGTIFTGWALLHVCQLVLRLLYIFVFVHLHLSHVPKLRHA